MRKSWMQLYAPFLALAIVQALLIAVAPSRGPESTVGAFGDGSASGVQAGSGSGGTGATGGDFSATGDTSTGTGAIDPATGQPIAGGDPATGGGGAAGGDPAAGGGGAPAGGGGEAAAAAGGGDTSHCKGDKQIDLLINNNPPCKPKFAGNNGGATYQGVTDKTIKVIIFQAEPNAQVDQILGAKGLAVTAEDNKAFYDAAFKFINEKYELHGRKIEYEIVIGKCPTTPPNYDQCNAAAQEVVKKKPALVVWITSLYASVFDIWAKAGIPSIGGSSFDENFYVGRRPFRYDVGMDGTEAADHIAEYYCKKMAKQKADHSGRVIHAQVGSRGQVDRKLGIVVPEIEANVLTAKRVQQKVAECGGGNSPIFTYESDIERATEQTRATVAGLISNKVTTVTCMCDPIAPVFLTQGMTTNSYFPEFLLPGLGLLDYDLLGQLYDPAQMQHAFGPSHIFQPTPLDEGDPARVWQATGHQGHPCGNNGCGLQWAFANMAGIAVSAAGPNFNPGTLEQGLLNLPPQGGWDAGGKNPSVALYKFGQGDYNGTSDVRQVFWDANATSPVDGSKGAYVNVDGGRRWELGQWPGGGLAGIPVAAQ